MPVQAIGPFFRENISVLYYPQICAEMQKNEWIPALPKDRHT